MDSMYERDKVWTNAQEMGSHSVNTSSLGLGEQAKPNRGHDTWYMMYGRGTKREQFLEKFALFA